MYFKKLELVGFKSFADKTAIEFEAGVTAIVGPNGCGKSNISDAIRWVLGEQSAKSLRGSMMSDVIFNGSSAKEPLGFAEVSLTLSNESRILPVDYDEVTITRRLYRSGESEYLLNKNQVRLRDIHEMLMGTGIGTESYSIIEQGKMDMVLNSRPEDRREIFEEAAGITKFKSQKKEALRKLEQTDQNLLRVNDIIQEVRRQISSIERQAKKAEAYKIEFEKLKKIELAVACHEFSIFEGQKNSKESELEELRFKEGESQLRAEEYENIYAEKKAGLDEFDRRLHEGSLQEVRLSGEIRRDQDRLLLNRERMGELAERRVHMLRQIEGAQRRVEEFSAEHQALADELIRAQQEETEGLAFLATVEADFAAIEEFVRSAQSQSMEIRDRLEGLADHKGRLQSELATVRAEMSALDNRLRRLREEEAYQKIQLEKVVAEFNAASDEVLKSDSSLSSLRQTKEQADGQMAQALARVQEVEAALDSAKLNESTLRSKVEFLKDLKNRREGFWGGVKALLERKDAEIEGDLGIVGLLADLVQVEKGYEFAVEAALGAFLQAVIFKTDEDLIRAADFLRAERKGRANLLSLEHSVTREMPLHSEGEPQPILQFVGAQESVSGLLQNLLCGVYLAQDIPQALSWSNQNADRVYVTRSGERIEGRMVSAGSNREDENFALVGRESRIQESEEQWQALTASIIALGTDLQSAGTEQAQVEEVLKNLSGEILKIQFELGEQKSRLRHLDESKKRIEDGWRVLDSEIQSLGGQEQAYHGRSGALETEYASAAAEERSLSERMIQIAESVKEKTQFREDLLVRLAQTRSRQAAFTLHREKIEKDRSWILESRQAQEELLISYQKESEGIAFKEKTLEIESLSLESDLSRLAEERDELFKTIEGLKLRREEIAGELQAVDRDRQSVLKDLDETRRKLHEHQMESAQLGFEMDRLKERIFNAYQIDLTIQEQMAHTQEDAMSAFGAGAAEGLDFEQAKADMLALREKLQKMGPVNLVAIEEHSEMKARFEFLTQQEKDLIQSKEDLHKAIVKINRTTKELFAETFEKVHAYFAEYFKLLFNGGQAELVLLDEQNILESGIDIVARPPGKKPQSITLLSGGEKALTAVALMFSLFRVKPSPFCILDEIDAPLDETNVERFCNVLKDFITGSQFILITHNKRTMNLADAMYGITMAQTGVSRVVSVKFNERRIASQPVSVAADEAPALVQPA